MFAIIKTGGKQLKVSQGEEIFIEKIIANEGDQIEFKEVLMIDNQFGTPLLQDALVTGTVIKQGKQKKIVVFHYKPKKTHHKKYGHRQPYTKIKIDEILLSAKDKKVVSKAKKVAIDNIDVVNPVEENKEVKVLSTKTTTTVKKTKSLDTEKKVKKDNPTATIDKPVVKK